MNRDSSISRMQSLNEKDKVTLFQINGLAMTSKNEVIVAKLTDTHIVFKYPRKRKLFQIKLDTIGIAMLGHDLPIGSDMDGDCYRGNACYNLVSKMNADDVRKYLEEHNLIDMSESEKAHVMLMTPEEASDSNSMMAIDNCLYPKATNSSSLVDTIRRTSKPEIHEND